ELHLHLAEVYEFGWSWLAHRIDLLAQLNRFVDATLPLTSESQCLERRQAIGRFFDHALEQRNRFPPIPATRVVQTEICADVLRIRSDRVCYVVRRHCF